MSSESPSCPACRATTCREIYAQDSIPIHSCLMVTDVDEAKRFPRGRLQLCFCEACGFLFNAAFEPERMRYSTAYEETQGYSARFRTFLEDQARTMVERHRLKGRSVLEIGCGKGEFLVLLCENGAASGIGLDPSYRPERTSSAAADSITFIQDLYGEAYTHLDADFVCCRHTLEHIADVRTFMETVRATLGDRPDTVVFFELPEARRILREQAFWDVYYEHCSYFSAGSLARLFRAAGFHVDRLAHDYDDQYLLLEGRPADGPVTTPSDGEESLETLSQEVDEFAHRVRVRIDGMRGDLEGWRREGKRVALWGSGSKAVSYLNALQVEDEVAGVVDINPHKHGKFLAGTGHEIVAPEALTTLKPDVVLAMNPIYRREIQADLDRLGVAATLSAV